VSDPVGRIEVEIPELAHPQPIPVAVWIKDMLFSSPIGPRRADGTIPEDVDEQFDVTFENLDKLLTGAGVERSGVAMVRVYLDDPSLRDRLNERWVTFFDDPPPARHVSQNTLPAGAHVLLTVVAVR
jgi:enamine deaminase RidA (YjgF/YER057c/UK114 family)